MEEQDTIGELYQAEWCPFSHRVRQRLTELGLSYVVRQVPADPNNREEMRRRVGSVEIPVLVLGDGTVVDGDAEEIVGYLDAHFHEREDVAEHRAKAADSAGATRI